MELKFILKLFIIAFLIFSFMVFIHSTGLNLTDNGKPKKLLKVYETFDTRPLSMDKSDAFCETHLGSSGALDTACNSLVKNNCNETSCCNWTSNQKCVAGGQDGPTFSTNKIDYYYFQGKCYGNGCP